MDFLKVAGDDIKRIFKNKFVMISVIAIIVVPLLYSILYLDAFWDPYARLEDVKIAVVNLDKGTVFDGEEANYGEDVVDELRNNNEVGWTITDAEDAKKGLEGNEYYAMFVIPENFSECITAAKEDAPQVAELLFTGNDKKNFIASQINRQVKSELSAKITSTITNTYVTVAFESLEEVKDGLVDAADGSKQLYDGIDTLHGKVPDLEDGATQLNDGSNQLYDGQVALNDGVNKINNGLGELNSKIPALSAGAAQLNDGSSQLYNGQVALNDGINSLSAGVSTLNDKLPTLVEGVNALNSGSSQLAAGSDKLYAAFAGTIYPSVNKLKDGANLLNDSLKANKDSITALSQGATALDSASNDVKTGIDTANVGYNNVADGVNELISSMASSQAAVQSVGDALAAAIKADPTLATNTDIMKAVNTLDGLKQASDAGAGKIQQLQQGTEQLRSGMSTLNSSVNLYADKVKEFSAGAGQLANSVGAVSAGVEQISSGLTALEAGLNEANEGSFGEGLKSLNVGANSLDAGVGSLTSNVPTLSDGVSALYNGTNELKAGSDKLVAGQTALKDGVETLSASVPALSEGVSALYSGSGELKAGSDKLVDGQSTLRDGISKLAGNIPTLADGVNKLHDGSKELSDALKEGADKITGSLVNEAEEMGDFVAEPIFLDDEAINPVPNYGSGFAPYFILLSLWIGAIMIFFVVPQQTADDEKLSKFDKAFGKFLSFSFIAVIQAILVGVSVLLLGLEPTNVPMFFAANILLSLVFVAIIQCLIFTLGDAGRLLAIVLLILQLTACAGTFPLEVVPKFFQVINPLMPFTYAITALREIVSAATIDYGIVGRNLGILAVVGVVFLVATIILKNKGEKIQATMEERKLETV